MRRIIGMLGVGLLLATGCTVHEGDRCNPSQFNSDCEEGLTCIIPANCAPVSFCCPEKVTPATSSSCQPCSAPDGGATD